jgi:phosphatidylinositol alpha-1,6-mannosyltransferase
VHEHPNPEEYPLKIGILSPEFPPAIGGVETYAFQFVQALGRARPDWDISVFTRPHLEGEIQMPGVRVLPVLRRRLRMDRPLLLQQDMDAWHVMNAAYGWLAAEAEPVVVTVHGNDFLRPYLPLLRPDLDRFLPGKNSPHWLDSWEREYARGRLLKLLAETLPSARRILTNSRYTEQVFLERFPACRGRTLPAMVGVAEEFFAAERTQRAGADPVRLVTISRLSEPRKNIDLVLRALARLAGSFSYVYRVVGEGRDRARLAELAAELGIADRVQFLGRVAQERMAPLLAASDLFILTSSVLEHSHEGFGIVYLEANACGTPVLAARVGGAVEAVAEGVSGMFVEVPELDLVTDSLRRFLSGEIRFAAAVCRDHARRFTWQRVVDAALDGYGGK